MITNLKILHGLSRISFRDFFTLYPPRIYLIAWFPRIATQVIFFTLLANFAGGEEFLEFALIGNPVYLLTSTAVVFVTASVNWERRMGTLPLIISSPSSVLLVLSGRNFGMGFHGYLTGIIGLFVVGLLMGLKFTFLMIIVILFLLVLITFSSYCLGLFIGGFALRTRGFHNVLSNLFTLVIIVICGVNFPRSILPEWAIALSSFLPLTHGLQAIRYVIEAKETNLILQEVIYEALVGLFYLAIGLISFSLLLKSSRKHGAFDLQA